MSPMDRARSKTFIFIVSPFAQQSGNFSLSFQVAAIDNSSEYKLGVRRNSILVGKPINIGEHSSANIRKLAKNDHSPKTVDFFAGNKLVNAS